MIDYKYVLVGESLRGSVEFVSVCVETLEQAAEMILDEKMNKWNIFHGDLDRDLHKELAQIVKKTHSDNVDAFIENEFEYQDLREPEH